jgi:uncharacterized protein
VTREEKDLRTLRHARIRRVKQLLKWMPRRANLDRYPVVKWFAKAARKRPYLWSFKVPSCTPAFYFGSLIAFMPLMGVQIILAFAAAIFLRANLPITIGLQAISNPVTIAFLYPLNFMIGRKTMDFFGLGAELNPIMSGMQATFLGGIVLGLTVGASLDLFYRLTVYEASKLASARRRERADEGKEAAAADTQNPESGNQQKDDELPAQTPGK